MGRITEIIDGLEKGKKVPVGTVSGKYKKVADGKWVEVSSGEKKKTQSTMVPEDQRKMLADLAHKYGVKGKIIGVGTSTGISIRGEQNALKFAHDLRQKKGWKVDKIEDFGSGYYSVKAKYLGK